MYLTSTVFVHAAEMVSSYLHAEFRGAGVAARCVGTHDRPGSFPTSPRPLRKERILCSGRLKNEGPVSQLLRTCISTL